MKTFFISKILNTQVSNAVLRFLLLTFITHRSAPARKHHYTLFLFFLLLGSQHVQAQIYSFGTVTGGSIAYYDITLDTWVQKLPYASYGSSMSVQGRNQVPFNGTYMYYTVNTGGSTTGDMVRYHVENNTRTLVKANPNYGVYEQGAVGFTVLVGDDLYETYTSITNGKIFYRLNGTAQPVATPSPNTHTSRAAFLSSATAFIGVYDGTDIYASTIGTTFGKYNITANTWTALASPPASISQMVVHSNGTIYALRAAASNLTLYQYDKVTNTWSSLAILTVTGAVNMAIDQTNGKIYALCYSGLNVGKFWVYDIVANTWTAKADNTVTTSWGRLGHAVVSTSCAITATPTATQATCTAGVANADAKLDITAHAGGGTKVGYSIGSSYTGPAFATATTLTAAPFAVATGLANPAVNQPYTIRVYKDAACYKDFTLMLEHKKCITADIAVTVATTPQTANQGETLTYTVTVTNNGPDTSPSVMVDVPIPANVTYLNGTASQGAYSTVTKKWTVGSMANAATNTLVLSLKVN